MKKYVKPELFFENYELSQHIAVCDFDLVEGTLQDAEHTCRFKGDDASAYGQILFTNNSNDCSIQSYCYSIGADGWSIFNS